MSHFLHLQNSAFYSAIAINLYFGCVFVVDMFYIVSFRNVFVISYFDNGGYYTHMLTLMPEGDLALHAH